PEEMRLLSILQERHGETLRRGMLLDFAELAEAAALAPDTLDELLLALGFRGVLDVVRHERRIVLRRMGDEPIDEAAVLEWVERYRQEQRGKLNAMVGIAMSGRCRRHAIRSYFGERDVPQSCGSCDVCRGERPPLVSREASQAPGWLEIREVLERVAQL